MSLQWLFQWWNAVYTVPLAFVLVVLAVSSTLGLVGGAIGELGHDVEADHNLDVHAEAGHDADLSVDHDLDADTDLPGGHHAGGDLDGDGDSDLVDRAVAAAHGLGSHGFNPLISALVLIGVGRAPLLMLVQILLLLWGLVGIGLHQGLGAAGPGALVWSVPLTLCVSVLGTRSIASVFGRYFKGFETAAVRGHQIVGRTGKVVYRVTPEEGTITLRDHHGTLHRVRARSLHAPIESGREVIVVGYDPGQRLYQVDDAQAMLDRD
jgi:membrane protein implicated in regulation of membrane protease activity